MPRWRSPTWSAATTTSRTPPSSCWCSRRWASTPPRYAHLPLLHGPDGKKLSKRHGAASVQELREAGYLPAAIRNYLALLGWGTDDDTTLMSTAELVERFRIDRVGRSSAVFDEKKLRWMNGRFMRELDAEAYERAPVGAPVALRPGGGGGVRRGSAERRRAARARSSARRRRRWTRSGG